VREINSEVAAKGERMLCISDTAGFDAGMMNHYLGTYCPDQCESMTYITGGYRPIRDISAFYFGLGGSLKYHGSLEMAMKGLAIKELPDWVEAYQATHDPLDDVNSIGAAASFILSHCE
jgi:hypothetical protein